VAVGNFDLKIPTENIPSVNPLVFSEFLVVILVLDGTFFSSFFLLKLDADAPQQHPNAI
jgi:hypothetical protein